MSSTQHANSRTPVRARARAAGSTQHAPATTAPRTRATDGDGDGNSNGYRLRRLQAREHSVFFLLFDTLFYFLALFFFFLYDTLLIFGSTFFFFFCSALFYLQWLNHHLMLQQGKIRQTLVGNIAIHLWKGDTNIIV